MGSLYRGIREDSKTGRLFLKGQVIRQMVLFDVCPGYPTEMMRLKLTGRQSVCSFIQRVEIEVCQFSVVVFNFSSFASVCLVAPCERTSRLAGVLDIQNSISNYVHCEEYCTMIRPNFTVAAHAWSVCFSTSLPNPSPRNFITELT